MAPWIWASTWSGSKGSPSPSARQSPARLSAGSGPRNARALLNYLLSPKPDIIGSLLKQDVVLDGAVLKASMVISGADASGRAGVDDVAAATLQCLLDTVPASLAGVVFLSGGQSEIEATAHLDAMNRMGGTPWPLSFSYGRALQAPALAAWSENPADNVALAQRRLLHRARMNGLAALGEWTQAMETEDAER